MSALQIGLISLEGDHIGHLVRAVQMLRSYGKECQVSAYSDVVDVVISGDEPSAGCCLLTVESDCTCEELEAIRQETEWSLGSEDGDAPFQVWVVRRDGQLRDPLPRPLVALAEGQWEPDMSLVLDASEFKQLCAWGQIYEGAEASVAGEWPGAVGG